MTIIEVNLQLKARFGCSFYEVWYTFVSQHSSPISQVSFFAAVLVATNQVCKETSRYSNLGRSQYGLLSTRSDTRSARQHPVRDILCARALSLPGGAVNYDRALLTLGISLQDPDAVVKQHGLDVEWRQDAFLVLQWRVVNIVLIGWQDDTHVAEVDVDGPQVRPTQRRALWEEVKVRICYLSPTTPRGEMQQHYNFSFPQWAFARIVCLQQNTCCKQRCSGGNLIAARISSLAFSPNRGVTIKKSQSVGGGGCITHPVSLTLSSVFTRHRVSIQLLIHNNKLFSSHEQNMSNKKWTSLKYILVWNGCWRDEGTWIIRRLADISLKNTNLTVAQLDHQDSLFG